MANLYHLKYPLAKVTKPGSMKLIKNSISLYFYNRELHPHFTLASYHGYYHNGYKTEHFYP